MENIKNKRENPVIITDDLDENIKMFKDIFNNDNSIVFREIEGQEDKNLKFWIIYAEGMADKDYINEYIIKPLLNYRFSAEEKGTNITETISKRVLTSDNASLVGELDEIVVSVVYGSTALLIKGAAMAILIDSKGWKYRAIGEPTTEASVRGSREGFTESINVNISLIRRRIKNPKFKACFKEIGDVTKTSICVCYIEGIANEKIIEEVNRRLDSINIDGILGSGYIEELIEERPYGLFETIASTERPDSVAGRLLEGRVAILCDGSPFVLTVPFIFMEYFQATEDYYNRYLYSSFNRILRYFGFFLTTSVPAIYLSLVTYHQEMIPTPLLLSISSSRQGVPLPTIIEIIIMLLTFEILREAGVRLPRPVGQTISIVGALVLGDAAVTARVVSPIMVIVVATTGISSFLVSKMQGEVIYIRIIFLILSSILGLYGYIFGVFGLFIYLCSLRSFGIPYMLNIGEVGKYEIKDTIIRAPWWLMKYRPELIAEKRPIRELGNKPIKPEVKNNKDET